jgi:hypothetical protein
MHGRPDVALDLGRPLSPDLFGGSTRPARQKAVSQYLMPHTKAYL